MDIIVNEDTSIVQIDGSQTANLPIIYVSTTTIPDHFVTVIDMTGYISTGRQLCISTTEGVQFSDGTTTAYIKQPFGYLSLAARSQNRWTVVNRDPFSVDVSTIRALDTTSIQSPLLSTTVVSTTQLQATSLTLNTLAAESGRFGNPFIEANAITVASSLRIGATAQAGSIRSTAFTGTDFTGAYATIAGPLDVGSITAIDVTASDLTIGAASFTNRVSTASLTASTVACIDATASSTIVDSIVASPLYLGATFLSNGIGSQISSISTALETIDTFIILTSTITVSTLGGSLSSIQLGSATILNPGGSLTTSTIRASPVIGQTVTGAVTECGPMSASTIAMNTSDPTPVTLTYAGFSDTIQSCWSISTHTLQAGQMSTSVASAGAMNAGYFSGGQIITETLAPTRFTATTELSLSGDSFYVPFAPITADTIITSTMNASTIQTAAVTDLVSITSDMPLYISSLLTPRLEVTHMSAQTSLASSIVLSNITVGKELPVNPSDPSVTIDKITPLDTPPFQTASGSGTFNDPFKTFNTSDTAVNFSFNNPSNQTLYLNMKIRHTNLARPNSGRNGGLYVYINGNLYYGILNIYEQTLLEYSVLDLKLSDYPMQSANPITGGTSNFFLVWNVYSSTVTTDELTMWVSNNTNAVDLANPSRLDPSVGLTVNRGVIYWPSTLYTTTIVNQFNDIQTRSLLYTGSLSQISDRAVKRNIEEFDMSQCLAAVQTPLHRYAYTPHYASTFHIQDRTRLGILTPELATHFPKSVTPETVLEEEREVASTDQLRYAHLAATKFLIGEIRRLRQKLLNL